jgi:hypothetical protein
MKISEDDVTQVTAQSFRERKKNWMVFWVRYCTDKGEKDDYQVLCHVKGLLQGFILQLKIIAYPALKLRPPKLHQVVSWQRAIRTIFSTSHLELHLAYGKQ